MRRTLAAPGPLQLCWGMAFAADPPCGKTNAHNNTAGETVRPFVKSKCTKSKNIFYEPE